MNYGKANVGLAGSEAALYEVFVGNTHPDSTKEKIAEVLIKCAEQFTGDEKLQKPLDILSVTCLTRPNPDGEPLRTKCWKVQVANKFREHLLKDEAYPYGWSHRRYFPKRIQHQVPAVDPEPKRQHLQADDVSSEEGATATQS